MKPKEQLKTFYSTPESDGTFAIVVAKTLKDACELYAQQLAQETGAEVDPTTLTLTTIDPSKKKVIMFTPPNDKSFDKPRFL